MPIMTSAKIDMPILYFDMVIKNGKTEFPITDPKMTRFMITLDQGVELVWHAFADMVGGEIYVKKIPSMNIMDIAKAISEKMPTIVIGVRPGEKLHEQMISSEASFSTYEYQNYYKILPQINDWAKDNLRIKGGTRYKKASYALNKHIPSIHHSINECCLDWF